MRYAELAEEKQRSLRLGTSFAEAVRIFARQSLLDGGMPFRPALKTWDELTDEKILEMIQRGDADIKAGRVHTQDEVDTLLRG